MPYKMRLELWWCGTAASCFRQPKAGRNTAEEALGVLYAARGYPDQAKFLLCFWTSRALLTKSDNGNIDRRNLSLVQLASHKAGMWQAKAWKDKDKDKM